MAAISTNTQRKKKVIETRFLLYLHPFFRELHIPRSSNSMYRLYFLLVEPRKPNKTYGTYEILCEIQHKKKLILTNGWSLRQALRSSPNLATAIPVMSFYYVILYFR